MTFKDYSKKQWQLFKQSFSKLDRRFIYILLLEIGLIALIIIGTLLWNKSLMAMITEFQGGQSMMSPGQQPDFLAMQIPDKGLVKIAERYILSTVFLVIYLLLAWSLMKQAIYSVLNRVKCRWKTSWKFLVTRDPATFALK